MSNVETAAPSATNTTKHHFEVLKYLKKIQSQHGISEEQHIRYRQYCTRRLHRVRTADDVKLGIKGGKKYKKQLLTADLMATPKHLTIPLLQAERAWAYALEDRTNLDEPLEQNEGRKDRNLKRHIVTRLRRATEYATEFDSMCTQTADEYTQLQSHIYKSWIFALYSIELEDWISALKHLTTSKDILTTLSTTLTDATIVHICNERLTKVSLYINFCNQRLKKSGADVSALDIASSQDPTLMAKLDHIKSNKDKTQNKNKTTAGDALQNNQDVVFVGNNSFKIQHPKIKAIYAQSRNLYSSYLQSIISPQDPAQQEQQQQGKVQNKKNKNSLTNITTQLQSYYDNIIIILNQDLKQIELSLSKTKTTQSEDLHRNILGLITYFNLLKYETTFYRHVLTLYDLLAKYDGNASKIPIKTVLTIIDRFSTIIKQGSELFSTAVAQNTNAGEPTAINIIPQSLALFNQFISATQLYYTCLFQLQSLETGQSDFAKSPTQICQELMTLSHYNQEQFKTLNTTSAPISTAVSPAQHQFGFITTLFTSAQYQASITNKLSQIDLFDVKLKVVYYQQQYAAAASASITSTTIPVNTNLAHTDIFSRLDTFEIGPQTQQYNVISLLPPTQPIPAKPFVFDSAYGYIVAENEYNQVPAAPVQQAQSQPQPQQTQPQAQEADDDAPKSFWSRLWG